MSKLTQGTQVFALVPSIANQSTFEVLAIQCATNFSPGGSPRDSIDTTCLEETDDRTSMPGLGTPGAASLTLLADPDNASHVRLYQLYQARLGALKWAVGWSDGKALPTVGVAGGLAALSLTAGGTGYTTAPTVAITGGNGTGATATATISGGEVTGFNITNPGSGYTSTRTVALSGGAGSGAAATALLGAGDDFVLPTSRTWFVFEGWIGDFPFDFAANSTVSTVVSIQRTGGSAWIRKTT